MADNKYKSPGIGSHDNTFKRMERRLNDPLVGGTGNKRKDSIKNPMASMRTKLRRQLPGKRTRGSDKVIEFIVYNYNKPIIESALNDLDIFLLSDIIKKLSMMCERKELNLDSKWLSSMNDIINKHIANNQIKSIIGIVESIARGNYV